jgi:hypothetical protein
MMRAIAKGLQRKTRPLYRTKAIFRLQAACFVATRPYGTSGQSFHAARIA